MRPLVIAALIVVLPPARLLAQPPAATPTPSTCDSAFAAAFRAYDHRDWRELARLAHPQAIARFRDTMLRVRREISELPTVYGSRGPIPRAQRRREYESWAALSAESLFVRTEHEQIDPFYARPALQPTVTRQVLGQVVEGDTLAHVVFRYTARWTAPELARSAEDAHVDVFTCQRWGGEWRPMLNGGLTAPLLPRGAIISAEQ